MDLVRLCCFCVNFTHSCIISNNFIVNEVKNAKVIYINEKSNINKLKNIVSRYYPKIEDKMFYGEWQNENLIHDYEVEEFVYIVSGSASFIDKINGFLEFSVSKGYIINCYEAINSLDIKSIINKHDYYINTTGIVSTHNIK